MALSIRTLVAVPVAGVLVKTGAGSVTLVNRSATISMHVSTTQAGLAVAADRDVVPPGGAVEMTLSGRRDTVWVGAASTTIDVAVYES